MWVLRQQKSIQKCRPPSFFQTNTIALHHALWLGQITPESNISCRCILTSSTNDGGICLKCSLNGVSSVTLITCSVEWIQPGGQASNPLRSNSSNNFSCFENVGFSFCLLIIMKLNYVPDLYKQN